MLKCSKNEITLDDIISKMNKIFHYIPLLSIPSLYWLLGTSVRKKPLQEGESVPSLVADGCATRVQFEDVNMCSYDNNRQLNRDLLAVCQRVNEMQPRLPDGRL